MSTSQVKTGPIASFGQRLHRLYQDLTEIRRNAHPGIQVFVDDANILEFCLVLTPQSGTFEGLALHFDVKIPDDWPMAPPVIESSVPEIEHLDIIDGTICADVLRLSTMGEKGGIYSSAYTLEGLFIQCLSFLSDIKSERKDGEVLVTGGAILRLFAREVDISPTATPTTLHLSCNSMDSTRQAAYRAEWHADKRPEITLETYITKAGRVTHKVKGEEKKQNRMHLFIGPSSIWARELVLNEGFRCAKCPYGTERLPCSQEPGDKVGKPACEDEWVFVQEDQTAQAPPEPEGALISHFLKESVTNHSSTSADEHADLDHKLQCFFLRSPLASPSIILGVGISFNFVGRTFTPNLDFLSEVAFDKYMVRNSIVEKGNFDHFLPLVFSSVHFERAEKSIWKSLKFLDYSNRLSVSQTRDRNEKVQKRASKKKRLRQQTNEPPTKGVYRHDESEHEDHFEKEQEECDDELSGDENSNEHITQLESMEVLYTIMNNVVASFVKSIEQGNAILEKGGVHQFAYESEQALKSYCLLFHLLICLSRKNIGVLERTEDFFKNIVANKGSESCICDKDHIPDLGELIVRLILISIKPTNMEDDHPTKWGDISGLVVLEMLARNSKWILKGNPELEIWENGKTDKEVEYRLKKSFKTSKTSLRLLMFQLTFVDLLVAEYADAPSESGLEHEGTSSPTIETRNTTILPAECPKSWRSGLMKLDDSYGFPSSFLLDKLMSEIPKITSIDNWQSFFQRVKMEGAAGLSNVMIARLLREAMYESEKRGYHKPIGFKLVTKSGETVIKEGSDWKAHLQKRRRLDRDFVDPKWLAQRG